MHLTTDTCIRADFGISKKFAADELSQTSGLIALTRKYCSPEVYDGEPRGRAADVFSLGCVFLEIATVIQGCSLDEFGEFRSHRTDPQEFNEDESYHGNLVNVRKWIEKLCDIPDLGRQRRWGIPQKLDVMQQMIILNPEERLSASQALEQLSGPRDCCTKERETYVVEEE
jgi:serine/threonine protein kinase